jgi:hypothetical protein
MTRTNGRELRARAAAEIAFFFTVFNLAFSDLSHSNVLFALWL